MGEIADTILNFDKSKDPKVSNTQEEVEEVKQPEDMSESQIDQLPSPTGYRLLVMPFQGKTKTKGGIVLTKETVERERLASIVCYVLRVGPDAYSDKSRFQSAWAAEGDWVIIGRYAGAKIPIEGGEIRIINDDEVIATVSSPETIVETYRK
jgi:co-chaperonin GroES (HSP10)